MTQQKQLLIAAIALIVLWLYLDGGAQASEARPGSVGGTTPANGTGAAPPAVVHKKQTPRIDVAGSIPDGADWILKQNGTSAGGPGGWMQAFYDQVWEPASRVALSSLAQEDWIYAMQFLQNSGGEFTRRDDVGEVGQAIIKGNDQRAGAEVFTQLISAVASIVPVIGPLISKVNAIQTGDLQSADAWASAMGGGAFGSLMRSTLSEDTAQTRHVLANYDDANSGHGVSLQQWEFDPRTLVAPDGPDAPLSRRVMLLPEEIGLSSMQNFSPPALAFTATNAAGKQVQFFVRQRLFTKYAGGWIMPWLCWHMVGDKIQPRVGLRQTVNACARVYRALDALIAGSKPWARENAPQGYIAEWTPERQAAGVVIMDPNRPPPRFPTSLVYFYNNPFLGPVLGSIFPPLSEDTRYVGSDGRRYSFYGEPMNGLPPGATGPIADDSDVDPRVRAASAHRAQIGVFTGGASPAPAMPLANAVFIPPTAAPPGSLSIPLGDLHSIQISANTGGSAM